MKRIRRHAKTKTFLQDISSHTPFFLMVVALIVLWFTFSFAIYCIESGSKETTILSIGDALFWGIAAFSTAGIADTPNTNPRSRRALTLDDGAVCGFVSTDDHVTIDS